LGNIRENKNRKYRSNHIGKAPRLVKVRLNYNKFWIISELQISAIKT